MHDDTPDGDDLAYRTDGDTHRVGFEHGTGEPSATVVTAVAAVAGCKQDDLDPLYDVLDPDALDSLFQPTDDRDHPDDVEVSFTYEGFVVSVRSYGVVEITEPGGPSDRAGGR